MIIYGGKIITMTGVVYEKGYIKVDGGKIAEIGEMEQIEGVAFDSNDVNAQGLTLYPGFVDCHCHLGMWEDSIGFEGEDGNEDTEPSTPHLRAIDSINPMDRTFEEAVMAGVTTVVTGVGSSNPIGGSFIAMKTAGSKRVDNLIVKSPLGIKFALGENPKTTFSLKDQSPITRMATVGVIREQLAKAKNYFDEMNKYNQTKGTEEEHDPPEFDIKLDALAPLFSKEIKAHFHCHRADDIFTAIRLAKEFDLDYVLIHCTEGALISEDLAEENSSIVLGPLLGDRSKPELKNHSISTPYHLDKQGISFGICTDHPETPIQYLPLTAAIAVRGGLNEETALKAITINGAKIAGIEDRVGSLEVGKDADIIGFKGSPLDIMSQPELIISTGKIIKK